MLACVYLRGSSKNTLCDEASYINSYASFIERVSCVVIGRNIVSCVIMTLRVYRTVSGFEVQYFRIIKICLIFTMIVGAGLVEPE